MGDKTPATGQIADLGGAQEQSRRRRRTPENTQNTRNKTEMTNNCLKND